jgi:hypothetical protein
MFLGRGFDFVENMALVYHYCVCVKPSIKYRYLAHCPDVNIGADAQHPGTVTIECLPIRRFAE